MLGSSRKARTAAKVLLAAGVLAAVLAMAGRSLAPSVPVATWVFWCALGLAAFVLVAALAALVDLQARHWALRKGGTEIEQWCWRDSQRNNVATPGQRQPLDEQAKK